MVAIVLDKNEVSLNSVRYRTKGPVTSALSSIYPDKQLEGDPTRDSQQRASVVAWTDWRGGIGLNKQRSAAADIFTRAWFSDAQLGYHEHLVPAALATLTADSGVAGVY